MGNLTGHGTLGHLNGASRFIHHGLEALYQGLSQALSLFFHVLNTSSELLNLKNNKEIVYGVSRQPGNKMDSKIGNGSSVGP